MPRLSYRRRLMLRKLLRVLGIVLAAAIVIGAALLLYLEPYVTYDRDGALFTSIRIPVSSSSAEPIRD